MEHNQIDNIDIGNEAGSPQIIELSSLKPLNDPNCTHEWVDDDEVIGSKRAQTCKHCPLGRWKKLEVSSGS